MSNEESMCFKRGADKPPPVKRFAAKKARFKGVFAMSDTIIIPNKPIPSWIENLCVGDKKLGSDWEIEIDNKKINCNVKDIKYLTNSGKGKFGSVDVVSVQGYTMAKKTIDMNRLIKVSKETCKYMVQELKILQEHGKTDYIVDFYGAFYCEMELILLMEYCPCGSLYDIYSKKFATGVSESILRNISYQLVCCLCYLDEHEILHRDFKPDNVLVQANGRVKLCDFNVSGLSKLGQNKTFIGTAAYLAPERLKGGTYDGRAETWSLGVSLIELATGRRVYGESGDGSSLSTSILVGKSPSPSIPEEKNMSPEFNTFIKLCVRKDRDLRPFPKVLKQHEIFDKIEIHHCLKELQLWIENHNLAR